MPKQILLLGPEVKERVDAAKRHAERHPCVGGEGRIDLEQRIDIHHGWRIAISKDLHPELGPHWHVSITHLLVEQPGEDGPMPGVHACEAILGFCGFTFPVGGLVEAVTQGTVVVRKHGRFFHFYQRCAPVEGVVDGT